LEVLRSAVTAGGAEGPTTDERRTTTDDRRPTTDDRRPTTDDRRRRKRPEPVVAARSGQGQGRSVM
jgi:hypothetical protein